MNHATDEAPVVFSHRQLVSAILSLVVDRGRAEPPPFGALGYELVAIEVPLTDSRARSYQADLHLLKNAKNLSLLVECKTSPEREDREQAQKYLATTGREVVQLTGVALPDPRNHLLDVAFVAYGGAADAVMRAIESCPERLCSGFGVLHFSSAGVRAEHDEFTDPEFSRAAITGISTSLDDLALEWLPYEASCSAVELANAIFQTLLQFFVRRKREFSLQEIASESNPFWEYLTPQHEMLGGRIQRMMRSIRGTALKGWIVSIPSGSTREDRWRFERSPTNRANTIRAFRRRHERYMQILSEERMPTPRDFRDIDTEQLRLPFSPEES